MTRRIGVVVAVEYRWVGNTVARECCLGTNWMIVNVTDACWERENLKHKTAVEVYSKQKVRERSDRFARSVD